MPTGVRGTYIKILTGELDVNFDFAIIVFTLGLQT